MAINQYPGVGPQNSDVAAAVVTAGTSAGFAATGPTTSEIAAALPTNSSIANAVAAAVPTNASITNIVQTYSAGPTTFNRVAILTNTQTWNHPDGASANNARRVQVMVLGGGGGGGAGSALVATGVAAAGGAGGGSGYAIFATTYVTGSVSVVVGAGGTGGAGGTSNTQRYGLDGNNGGYSAFGNITAGGGYYGAGNYNPSTGTTGGSLNGISYWNMNGQYWHVLGDSNANSRYYVSRGGSGGGFGSETTNAISGMMGWNRTGTFNSDGQSYPIYNGGNAGMSAAFGGSFGNRSTGLQEDSTGLTKPVKLADRWGWGNSAAATLYSNSTSWNNPLANMGLGINTRLNYKDYTLNATNQTVAMLDIEDIPNELSSYQSGGGTAGYGSGGATLNQAGFPGGRGLLGNGGSGGNSNTVAYNTAGAKSAGSGSAGSGYGGGGGGGSSAGGGSGACTSGSGGAGGAGVVVVYY
jgi:hypothetical protein